MSLVDCELLLQLRSLVNLSNWHEAAHDCSLGNSTTPNTDLNPSLADDIDIGHTDYGVLLYAFVTPIIFFIGLIGNLISLRVFFSKNLRKLSATIYLVAISLSDLLVLLIYVLLDWLRKGLRHFPGGHTVDLITHSGACESFLYFSYLFRFVSVWLLVIFTVERYIAACRPLQRRAICTKSFGHRAVFVVCVVGSMISFFKPIISGVYPRTLHGAVLTEWPKNSTETFMPICTFNPNLKLVNYIMEMVFGLSITAVPFIVIASFNALILRTLMQRDANIKRWKLNFKDSRIRWEFTVTLLVVSSTFICLNLPYFVVWWQRFVLTQSDSTGTETAFRTLDTMDEHYITRTIFYINYCINFFLYCLTGTYYRRELASLAGCPQKSYVYTFRGSVSYNTTSTHLKETSRL